MIYLTFIDMIISFVLILVFVPKLVCWAIEKLFPGLIKKCPECNEKYFEPSNYCEYCGKELKYLKDVEESEVIVVEEFEK